MTAITDKKLRDNLLKEKKSEMKKTIELIIEITMRRKTTETQYRKHCFQTGKKK